MCLEWALRLEDEQAPGGTGSSEAGLRGAVWDWSMSEERPGRSVMFYLAVEDTEGMTEAQVQEELTRARREWRPPERPDPTQVAALADAVTLRAPDDLEFLLLAQNVVSRARYWQAPEPEEALALRPELEASLTCVAEVLATAPFSRGWKQPMDCTAQWTTEPVQLPEWGPLPVRSAPAGAVEALERWRAGAIEEEDRCRRDYEEDPARQMSGTWWVKPWPDVLGTTRALPDGSPLGLWCEEDSFDPERVLAREITVPSEARILEVDGSSDWVDLCRQFPLDVTWSRRGDWGECTGRTSGAWVVPDWAALAASGVDAVHLTVRGYVACAGAVLDVGGGRASTVAGWDPDRTFWLCDVEPRGEVVTWESDSSGPGLQWQRVPAS